MPLAEGISIALVLLGGFFFFAGTVGLLRFPDVYTRLHAMTKADNVGLGLVVMGLLFQIGAWTEGVKLVLIWLLAQSASATACYLIARYALRAGIRSWKKL